MRLTGFIMQAVSVMAQPPARAAAARAAVTAATRPHTEKRRCLALPARVGDVAQKGFDGASRLPRLGDGGGATFTGEALRFGDGGGFDAEATRGLRVERRGVGLRAERGGVGPALISTESRSRFRCFAGLRKPGLTTFFAAGLRGRPGLREGFAAARRAPGVDVAAMEGGCTSLLE